MTAGRPAPITEGLPQGRRRPPGSRPLREGWAGCLRLLPLPGAALATGSGALVALALLGGPASIVLVAGSALLALTVRSGVPTVLACAGSVIGAVVVVERHGTPLTPGAVLVAVTLLAVALVVASAAERRVLRGVVGQHDTVLERIDAMVWEMMPNGGLRVSAAAQRLFGHPPARWAEPGFWSLVVHPEDHAAAQFCEGSCGSATLRVYHRDGSTRWVESRVADDASVGGVQVGVLIDRTDQVLAEREAERLLNARVEQDHLTGLANRAWFLDAVQTRLSEAPERPATVLFLDLNHFDEVNDALGHKLGDALLCSVAARVSQAAGEHVVARFGGDEFTVLIEDLAPEQAERLAAQIAEAIQSPLSVDGMRLRVSARMGLAAYPQDADSAQELVRCADVAVYQAKVRDRDIHRYDRTMDVFDAEWARLVSELDAAIDGNQLTLHHQPLVDVATGALIGTEALVRWTHPELGKVPPDRFIEVAEVSGQIKQITRWVVRQALVELVSLGAAGERLEVSVNLSVRNLRESDLLAWLENLIAEVGVDGRRLVVEITESTIMEDPTAAVDLICGLRRLGIRTWIDDFGTGYSSLARLRDLPVDAVKIDRSFVSDVGTTQADRDVLRGLINLVHSLGKQVVAEGVEQAQTTALLRELGCDLAQGYHLGRPMPIADFSRLVAQPCRA